MLRYFLCVGGALFGLLFLADWYFPLLPASVASAGDIDRTIIRIHSSRQWPAAIPIDTSVPMPKVPSAVVADTIPGPLADPPAREALAYAPPTASKASDKIRRRVRSSSRFAARETHRRLASSQSNWFAATW
jgi:hypothetical protein